MMTSKVKRVQKMVIKLENEKDISLLHQYKDIYYYANKCTASHIMMIVVFGGEMCGWKRRRIEDISPI